MKAFGLSFHGPCTFLIWWDFPSVSVSSLRLPKVNVLLDMLVWRTLRNAAATHAFLLCNFGATGVTLRGMSRDFWVRFEICFAPQNVPNNI